MVKKTRKKTVEKELEKAAKEIYPVLVKLRKYDLEKQNTHLKLYKHPQNSSRTCIISSIFHKPWKLG